MALELYSDNLKKLMNFHPWWIFIGKYYGFPECCIENFCLGKSDVKYNNLVLYGFIPCETCAKSNLDDLKQKITNNRILPTNLKSYYEDYKFFSILEGFYISYNINPINEILFRGGFDYLFNKYLNKNFTFSNNIEKIFSYSSNQIDKSCLFEFIDNLINDDAKKLLDSLNISSSITKSQILLDIITLKNDLQVLKNYTFN